MYHDLFHYELVIIAYYLCQHNMFKMEDIYPVYKKLLNKTLDVFPSGYYNSIVCNYKFYSPKIQDIQSHELNISTNESVARIYLPLLGSFGVCVNPAQKAFPEAHV